MFAFGVPKATVRGAAGLALNGDTGRGWCGVLGAGADRRRPPGAGASGVGTCQPLGPAQQDWEGTGAPRGWDWYHWVAPWGAQLAAGAGSSLCGWSQGVLRGGFGMHPAPKGMGTFCLPTPERRVRRLHQGGGPCSWPGRELSGEASSPAKWGSPLPVSEPRSPLSHPGPAAPSCCWRHSWTPRSPCHRARPWGGNHQCAPFLLLLLLPPGKGRSIPRGPPVSRQGDLPPLKCLVGAFLLQHLSLLLPVLACRCGPGMPLRDAGCSGCSLPASCLDCPSRGTSKTQRGQLEN